MCSSDLIYLSDFSSLVYSNARDICALILYPATLPNSLVAFNNFSLALIFVNLITMCLGVFLLGFCFLDLGGYFLSHVREVFNYNLFKYFLESFLSLFSFWNPYNANVGVFYFVPEVS